LSTTKEEFFIASFLKIVVVVVEWSKITSTLEEEKKKIWEFSDFYDSISFVNNNKWKIPATAKTEIY
jgi:hypothetical protein